MMQRLYGQLPEFARPSHPFMRYSLWRKARRSTLASRLIRALFAVGIAALLVFIGWVIATNQGQTPLDTPNPLDSVFLVLYWPLVGVQLLLRLFALSSTVSVISGETQRGTWDTLKVTTNGARLLMKTRWASIFYRLWMVLAVILALRVFFIVVALINLSMFQGRYLELLLSGTTPFGPPNIDSNVSNVVGVIIMAMMMTTCLLAPFTAIAFDAALGMYIGTLSRGRFVGVLGQLLLIVLRIGITLLVIYLGVQALSLGSVFGPPNTSSPITAIADNPPIAWLSAFASVAEGDLGLSLIHLDRVQSLWADLDYGALIGVAALGWMLLQAALANLLVYLAGRRAAHADKI
jgi:hypothetical protein